MSAGERGASSGTAPRVAVIDADRRIRQSLADVLRVAGMEVVGSAGNATAALELMAASRPSVVIVDPRLPDEEAGRVLLARVAAGWPSLRIVLMGWAAAAAASDGVATGTTTFVSKSAPAEEFVAAALAACDC